MVADMLYSIGFAASASRAVPSCLRHPRRPRLSVSRPLDPKPIEPNPAASTGIPQAVEPSHVIVEPPPLVHPERTPRRPGELEPSEQAIQDAEIDSVVKNLLKTQPEEQLRMSP